MSISVLRTTEGWYVQTPTGAARIATDAATISAASGTTRNTFRTAMSSRPRWAPTTA
jgi:hypothetical protein